MSASTIFLSAVAASIATAATIAAPASADTFRTSEVHYGDLDLSSTAGADALKARVARAARRVCTVDGDRSAKGASEAGACTKLAMAKAMPQIQLALANAGSTRLAEAGRVTIAAH